MIVSDSQRPYGYEHVTSEQTDHVECEASTKAKTFMKNDTLAKGETDDTKAEAAKALNNSDARWSHKN